MDNDCKMIWSDCIDDQQTTIVQQSVQRQWFAVLIQNKNIMDIAIALSLCASDYWSANDRSVSIYRSIRLHDLARKDKVWTRAIMCSIDFLCNPPSKWSATDENRWAASRIREVDEKHLECDAIRASIGENGERSSRQQGRSSHFRIFCSGTNREGKHDSILFILVLNELERLISDLYQSWR